MMEYPEVEERRKALTAGIDHPHYRHSVAAVAPAVRDSLAQDLIA